VPRSGCDRSEAGGETALLPPGAVYALGLRQDSLFELMDAVLTAPERRTLVRLSLCPCFRRRWSSTCDALADGSLDVKALRALFQTYVALPARGERPLWAVDGTHWPRPAAGTSPARTWEYRPLPGKPQQGVVPAWAYHWLVQVPEPEGSWVLPLDVQPRGLTADTPTQVAIRQIAQARASQASETPRPVVALDSAHEVGQLAQAHLDVDLVVRLAKNRVFRRAPGRYSGRGRPHTHGPVFKLQDASTHGPADRSASLEHPVYGTVTVEAWIGLHTQDAPTAPFSVVRVQVAQALQLGRIGPHDPAVRRARLAPRRDPAALEPGVERHVRHLQGEGQLAEAPLIRLTPRRWAPPPLRVPGEHPEPLEEVLDALGTELLASLRRAVAFGVQTGGDRGHAQPFRGQLLGAGTQLGVVAELL
jgi:DDE superfamily endonuclease